MEGKHSRHCAWAGTGGCKGFHASGIQIHILCGARQVCCGCERTCTSAAAQRYKHSLHSNIHRAPSHQTFTRPFSRVALIRCNSRLCFLLTGDREAAFAPPTRPSAFTASESSPTAYLKATRKEELCDRLAGVLVGEDELSSRLLGLQTSTGCEGKHGRPNGPGRWWMPAMGRITLLPPGSSPSKCYFLYYSSCAYLLCPVRRFWMLGKGMGTPPEMDTRHR